MIVIHIITGLGVGGAESMLLQLLRASTWGSTRHIVLTLTSEDALVGQIESLGVSVTNLATSGLRGTLGALFRARTLVKRHEPSLVMTWLHHADLFGVMLKCLCPKLPLVWNIRCSKLEPGYLPRRNLLIVRVLARLSSLPALIVANSHAGMQEHIAVGYRKERWRVLPNGFDTNHFCPDPSAGSDLRRRLGISAEAFVVGLVARYHPMKGFDLFMRAAGRLAAAYPQVHFVSAGFDVCWENSELSDWIAEAGLQNRISLLGPRRDIPQIMNALNVIVSSSTSEGFSNVIGEAMACGVPCVTTDVGDSALLVGETGQVITPGDEDALVTALQNLITIPEADYVALREAARSQILSKFSINNIAARYQELFDEFDT